MIFTKLLALITISFIAMAIHVNLAITDTIEYILWIGYFIIITIIYTQASFMTDWDRDLVWLGFLGSCFVFWIMMLAMFGINQEVIMLNEYLSSGMKLIGIALILILGIISIIRLDKNETRRKRKV